METQILPQLTMMLLNAENLFLLSDATLNASHLESTEAVWQKLSTSVYYNKPLLKLQQLAKVIAEVKPDVLMLAEVGGLESLANFNRLFLNGDYSPALIEGNSKRHIDVGYLVKKQLPFYFDLISNRNREINFNYAHEENLPSHKFSRDVAELHLFVKDRERPFAIALLTHLKSRLDPDGIDTNGFFRRQAEALELVQIQKSLQEKYNKVPMIIAGDFNGNASDINTDKEFKVIYESTTWRDICSTANLPIEDRATYYQVGRNAKSEGRQIDFVFLTPEAQKLLAPKSVKVYRYKNHLGRAFAPPATLDDKALLPSDHYPLVFSLENIPLID